MKVKELVSQLSEADQEVEVFIRCCKNPCGNVVDVGKADKTQYGFFGIGINCVIIEPANVEFIIK